MSERRKWPKPGETFAPADFGWHVFDAVEASRELNDAEKRVLVRLMRLAGGKTWVLTTSAWLAEALGKSRRRVWAAIMGLESKGYLTHESHGNDGCAFRFIWHSEYESFQRVRPATVPDSSQVCRIRHTRCDGSVISGVTDPSYPDAHVRNETFQQLSQPTVPDSSHPYKHDRTRITRYRERARENETEPVAPDGFDATETFNRIWNRHPRKTGRYLAEQAFSEALAEALNPAALAAEIERVHAAWTEAHEWRKEAGRYAPRLDRWLKDRGWLDGPPQAPEEERIIPYRPPWESEEGEEHA
jgi:hypothetical protein